MSTNEDLVLSEKTRIFPKSFFWNQVLFQVFIFSLSPILLILFLFLFSSPTEIPWTILGVGLGLSVILIFVLSLWSAFRVAKPLGLVLTRALRISSRRYRETYARVPNAEILEEDLGEFSELSRALSRIRRKLRRRREELEHERSEARALMSSLTDAVVSVDKSENIAFFNDQFQFLFLEDIAVKIGDPISLAFREPEVLSVLKDLLNRGESRTFKAQLSVEKDTRKHFLITAAPLWAQDWNGNKLGSIYGALLVFKDITELMKANQIRMEFVENASHELRTPLTSIKGFVETLKEDVSQNKFQQASLFLSIISRNVDRLIELVNDMLTISSLEHQSILTFQLTSAQELTHSAVEHLSVLAAEKNIVIRQNINIPDFYCDSKKIEQVMNNLINNSIKYVQPNGFIDLSWECSKDNKFAVLKIKDNGPGIAPEHLSRLFERFYRIDRARSRDAGGTGLGLAIVKHIIVSHGGQVHVESELGHGACFTCEIPFRTQSL